MIRERQARQKAQREDDMAHALEPAMTKDGHRVLVFANIDGLKQAQQVGSLGGEGVGLLRSEFLFMDRSSAPSEDEQAQCYTAILKSLGPDRPVVIRTLDVGGDKPLPYLPIPREDNPFLGERGIRVGLDRPEVLRTQLRAILRASSAGQGGGDVPDDRDRSRSCATRKPCWRKKPRRSASNRSHAASWWKCRPSR